MKTYYYLVSGTTIYDGLEFYFSYVCERKQSLSYGTAETEVCKEWVHKGTGEELERIDLAEISKKEFEVFTKYHF